jgi:thioredoxin-related protein
MEFRVTVLMPRINRAILTTRQEKKMWIRRFSILASLLVLALIVMTTSGISDPSKSETKESPNWVKYDEGLKLAMKTERPILVDFYTNWCRFCKKMDKETFSDTMIAEFLNENFVTVKVNAESRNTVKTADGAVSERQLARSFGVRGYPTYWFLKPNGEKINYSSGYAPPNKFINILRYIGEGHYESKTFKDYLSEISGG